MRFADAEQGLGIGVLLAWLLVAAFSVAGRLPRVGRLTRSTLIGTGTATGLFAAQASVVDAVADPEGLSALDPPILQWLIDHRTPAATVAFRAITTAGSTVAMAVLAAVAVLALAVKRRHRDAAVVFVAAVGAALLIDGLKNFYRRPRPPELTRLGTETNYSLPSGHALGSTVVLGILTAIVVFSIRRRPARAAAVTCTVVAVVAVGSSRLYLGVHWLTDVLDGWLVGGAWLALCITVLLHNRSNPPAASRTGADSTQSMNPSNDLPDAEPTEQQSMREQPAQLHVDGPDIRGAT